MKKEYFKPAAKVYQVQPAAILAGSGTTEQVPVGGPGSSKAKENSFDDWE